MKRTILTFGLVAALALPVPAEADELTCAYSADSPYEITTDTAEWPFEVIRGETTKTVTVKASTSDAAVVKLKSGAAGTSIATKTLYKEPQTNPDRATDAAEFVLLPGKAGTATVTVSILNDADPGATVSFGIVVTGDASAGRPDADSFEAVRARVAADPSLTVRPIQYPGLANHDDILAQQERWRKGREASEERLRKRQDLSGALPSVDRTDPWAYNRQSGTKKDETPEPPAGPSGARIDEVLPVLQKANIETMTIALPNDVRLLLSKLPDGTFWGTFEVTQDQWLSVMGGENPSAEDNVGDDHPVDSIWPADALAFVEKLNALPAAKEAGLKFRIPSEEEWEAACLAGNKKSRDFGLRLDGEKVTKANIGQIAWCMDFAGLKNSGRGATGLLSLPSLPNGAEATGGLSHSVGRKQPNAFGLYDMHGNVAELAFAKDSVVASSRRSRFASKGGYWMDNSDACEAYKTGRTGVMEEPPEHYTGAKRPTNYTLGLRVAASVLDSGLSRIFAAAKQAEENGGADFFGFYPGMPEADAAKLAKHYGLAVGDPETRGDGGDERNEPGWCQFVVDASAKTVVQIRFDIQALQTLTKERYSQYDRDKFCEVLSKAVGKLDLVREGKRFGETFLYRRNTPDGTAVSFGESVVETRDYAGGPATRKKIVLLTIEDSAATAQLAAARMAAANNARIEAVEPVLANAGIKTKTIELPGGVKLLLTLLPNERYLGTFEVTQAQYVSLMGTNASQCAGADFPVDSVSVQDCLDFIAKANELPAVKEEDLRFRLPSLDEWKTACRAGTDGDYCRGLDGSDVVKESLADMMLSPADRSRGRNVAQTGAHPVGVAKPNAFGLYDMFGNVSEWVGDKKKWTTDKGTRTGQFHMGGAWKTSLGYIKPVRAGGNRDNEDFESPEKTSDSIGFRVSVVSMECELKRAKDEAAKAYALSNNGRIDAVKPVLEKAGIETKEVELPGGVRMLLNKTPDGAWAAAFEVTQGQWKSLLRDNPASFQGDPVCTDDIVLEIWRTWKDENPETYRGTGLPVDQVSPGDIRTFLVLLNALPSVREAGLAFHLPTLDEWVYIARAGAKSKYAKPLGGGDASVDLMGWHEKNIETPKAPHLQIVGQKLPNAFGLYDVHGNAAEITDCRHGGVKVAFRERGGSVGPGRSSLKTPQQNLAIDRPIWGFGESLDEALGTGGIPPFSGFRVIATEGGLRHLVNPELAAASNARIDAGKSALDAKGIETKTLDLPGGVKLLLTKLPDGLWAGTFEVTQAQFLSVLGTNPSLVLDYRDVKEAYENPWLYRTGDRPVDTVGKADAEAFLDTLNKLPGLKTSGLTFRLPSYGEWARFCDARLNDYQQLTEDAFVAVKPLRDREWLGDGKIVLGGKGNPYRANSSGTGEICLSQPVGGKAPNRYGLYDMIGNVPEWTSTLTEKAHERQQGGTGDRFLQTGSALTPDPFTKPDRTVFYSVSSSRMTDGCANVGFRIWAEPTAPAAPAAPNPAAVAFVQESNARIDAVKPVLKKAGIKTKTIELPGGARILMNKLPNGAWMAAFETTQAQFASVFGRNPSRKISQGGDRAVDNVSWNQAAVYVAVLNELPSVKESGFRFRLPSSAEWEYACRGGDDAAPLGKPLEKGKGKLDNMGWYDKNSDIEGIPQTHRVGMLDPNAFGLYDMIGNVAEWTATAYSKRADGDNTAGPRRIWRGGSWLSPKEKCTAAYRGLLSTDTIMPDTGFRLYATKDGTGPKDERTVFRAKEYNDAVKKEPPPDDRTAEEKLLGAIIEFGNQLEKEEMRLRLEEAGLYPDLLD